MMVFRRVERWVVTILVLLAAAPLVGAEGVAQEPSGKSILREATEYLAQAESFSVEIAISAKTELRGIGLTQQTTVYSLAAAKPNRLALVPKEGIGALLGGTVCDGRYMYHHMPVLNTYEVVETPEDPIGGFIRGMTRMGPMALVAGVCFFGVPEFEPDEESVPTVEYVGPEQVDGRETHHLKVLRKWFNGKPYELEIWVDRGEQPLLRRIYHDMSARLRAAADMIAERSEVVPGGPNFEEMYDVSAFQITADFRDWKMNIALPPDTFVFTPPPGAKTGTTWGNEASAQATLHAISAAQEEFREAAEVDQDGDGVGEYGFLDELLGISEIRGTTRAADPAYLPASLEVVNGVVRRSGYNFKVYLPRDSGAVLSAPSSPSPSKRDGADLQEKHFVCYAWPAVPGRTGVRAFAVREDGDVWETSMQKVVYEGGKLIPEASAAYTGEPFTSAFGGSDGNVWIVADPLKRKDEARRLGEIEGPEAMERLRALLKDEEGYVRDEAIRSLVEIGDERAASMLAGALLDKEGSVRERIATALDAIGWTPTTKKEAVAYLVAKEKWDDLAELGADAADALFDVTGHEDSYVRMHAALALGEIGDRRAVGPLTRLLKGDPRMRELGIDISLGGWDVVETLGKLKDPRAVEPLIRVLESGPDFLRSRAAEALGKIGDLRAVGPLIGLLKDEKAWVGRSAAEALAQLGWEPTSDEEKLTYYVAAKDLDKLAEMGAEAMEPLLRFLGGEDEIARAQAAEQLRKIGDGRAVEPLIAALKDEDKIVRDMAARALGTIGDPRAVPALIDGLKDEEEWVRCSSAGALGDIGDNRAAKPLEEALEDSSWKARATAAYAFGKVGGAGAAEKLKSMLGDEEKYVRRNAVRGLGVIGNELALDAVIEALDDDADIVRAAAARTLGEIGRGEATEALIARLEDESAAVRSAAAEALGTICDPEATGPLEAALRDEDEDVRKAVTGALERIRRVVGED